MALDFAESKLFELAVPTSSQGPDIEKLQKFLLVFKYPVNTTGILDDATKQALSQAQKDVGIPVTGIEHVNVLIFGPFGETWKGVKKEIPKVHFTGENN